MGKKSIWRRVLAVVLALSMVCSVQTMSVYADIFGLETKPVQQTADQPEQNETEPTVTPTPTPEAEATPTPIPESENEEDGSSRVVYTNHTSTVKEAVNFRREMNTADDSNIITVLQAGTVVKVLMKETAGDMAWYQIEAEVTIADATGEQAVQTQTGYVSAAYLGEPQMVQTEDSTETEEKDPEVTGDDEQEIEETPSEEPEDEGASDAVETPISETAVVTAATSLYAEPTAESDVLAALEAETTVSLTARIETVDEGLWYKVEADVAVGEDAEAAQKITGYISASSLEIQEVADEPEEGTETDGTEIKEQTAVNETGIVNAPVNLREKPVQEEGNIIEILPEGTEVNVRNLITLENGEQWYEVGVLAADTETEPDVTDSVNRTARAARSAAPAAQNISDGTTAAGYVSANFVDITPKDGDNTFTDGEEAKTDLELLEEMAEGYYGGENPKEILLGVSMVQTSGGASDGTIMTGQEVRYNVIYNTKRSSLYNYNPPESLVDYYEDVQITVQLPAGITIEDINGIKEQNGNVIEDITPGEGNSWIFKIKGELDPGIEQSFEFWAEVDGNGTVPIGREYSFEKDSVSITADFPIMNKFGDEPVVLVGKDGEEVRYNQTVSSTPAIGTLEAASNDEWTVEKEVDESKDNDGVVISGDEVTVHYLIRVGLEKDGKLINDDPEVYAQPGRTPFASVTISDVPVVYEGETPREDIIAEKAVLKRGDQVVKQLTDDSGQSVEEQLKNLNLSDEMASCEGNVSGNVDGSAPYYTQYSLEITYPYKPFEQDYTEGELQKLKVQNEVTLNYTLQGSSEQTAKDDADVEIGELTEPAILTVSKKILGYDGTTDRGPYKAGNSALKNISGPAEFTVTDESGNPATLYKQTKGADTQDINDDVYELVTDDGKIYIDPEPDKEDADKDNVSSDGTITLYLDPGSYKIEETDAPEKTKLESVTGASADENGLYTLTAGQKTTLTFVNKEELGAVKVIKTGTKDGEEKALGGAVFGLYTSKDAEEPLFTGTTDSTNGEILFAQLKPGTYWLKEISAPDGYKVDAELHEVTVQANQVVEKEVNNTYGYATIKFEKKYQNYKNGTWEILGSALISEFEGAFVLEYSVDEGKNWEIYKDLSFESTGTVSAEVPVYHTDGTVIQYRIKETLPEGWSAYEVNGEEDPNKKDLDADNVVYSESVTDIDQYAGKGSSEPRTVTMYNARNGELTLTKKVKEVSAEGEIVERLAEEGEFSFDLYSQVGNGELEKANPNGYKTDAKGTVTASGLNIKAESGGSFTYWWVETGDNISDYEQTTTSEIEKKKTASGETVTAIKAYTFEDGYTFKPAGITITNTEKEALLEIKKVNSYDNSFVEGAKVTVTDENGDTVSGYAVTKDTDGNLEIATSIKKIENIEIESADGLLYVVKPGTYTVTESECPDNYKPEQKLQEVTVGNSGKETVTIKNKPDPKLSVKKVVSGSSEEVKNVAFEICTGTEKDGKLTGIKAVMDSTEAKMTVTSGSDAVQLPAGTYYLKETSTVENTLSPSNAKYASLYVEKYGSAGLLGEDDIFYFKAEVREANPANPTIVTITNIPNTGDVQGTKVKEDNSSLEGAKIGIWKENIEGTYTEETAEQTATSGKDGTFKFENLPVYNDEGEKITYIIKELEAPKGYSLNRDAIKVTLEADKTVNTYGDDSTPIQIVNKKNASLTVVKSWKNIWEYQFTGKTYRLSDVQIALYEQDPDNPDSPYKLVSIVTENADGTEQSVDSVKTNALGEITIGNLDRNKNYIAVEVGMPEDGIYTYLEPANGTIPEKIPETISKSELEDYNYVSRPADSEDPDADISPRKEMLNEKHWTQLQIYKYAGKVNTDWNNQYNVDEGPENNNTGRKGVNGSQFQLYQQVLDDTTSTALSFDLGKAQAQKDGYTLVGNYTSGTMPDDNGDPRDGWFATDILEAADNVVYWLVETKAAPGYKIIPTNNPILFYNANTSYTNATQKQGGESEIGPSNIAYEYTVDAVTKENMPNEPPVKGPGKIHEAVIRLDKWAPNSDQAEGTIGEDLYVPLGNVTYEIWLADTSGNLKYQVDTVTTGLENEGTDGENLTARAISYLYYEWICEDYARDVHQLTTSSATSEEKKAELAEQIKNILISNGLAEVVGNDVKVRMALREVSSPGGYQLDTTPHYMWVYFDKAALDDDNPEAADTTETNDTYYIGDGSATVTTSLEGTLGTIGNIPNKEEKVRLVNLPVDNYAVTVSKYGYTPDKNTFSKTEEELDSHFEKNGGRTPLTGVTMRLQKKEVLQTKGENGEATTEEKWQDYDYQKLEFTEKSSDAVFTTKTGGSYSFPNGLVSGEYRIIEDSAEGDAAGYDLLYDSEEHARYFTVTDENLVVSMYNPRKTTLSIKKESMADSSAVSGWTFTLNPVNGDGTAKTEPTGSDGKATFTNIDSGTYYLTESGTGYSTDFLSDYVESLNNKNLEKFITSGTGLALGNISAKKNMGMTVTDVKTLQDYNVDSELVIENPKLGSLTITKKNEKNLLQTLNGAKFKVYAKEFTEDFKTEAIKVGDNNAPTDLEIWTDKGEHTTAAGGKVTVNNLKPGIYYVVETTAPDGYELNLEGQYVVLTGGLDEDEVSVTIGGTPCKLNATSAALTFTDKPKAKLQISKTVVDGAEIDSGLAAPSTDTFTFNLYEQETGGSPVGTVTIGEGATENNVIDNLSLGETYYLEEVEKDDYALTGLTITVGDQSVKATLKEQTGKYAFTVTEDMSGKTLQVEAKNTYLKAKVTILKVDQDDPGADIGLTGAEFTIAPTEGSGTSSNLMENSDQTNCKGQYYAYVMLPGTDENGYSYTITETKAADDGYALPDDEEDRKIQVTLKPGEHVAFNDAEHKNFLDRLSKETDPDKMRANLIMPNRKGATININKYDNVYEAENAELYAGAEFTLWYSTDRTTWYSLPSQKTTAKGGSVAPASFSVSGTQYYAVSEGKLQGFSGVDSVYAVDAEENPTELEKVKLSNGTEGYLLNPDGWISGTYEFNVYNTPDIKLIVTKEDVSNSSITPEAHVSVYKISENLEEGAELTEEQINEFMESDESVQTAWTTETYDDKPCANFNAEQGATYLVVETATRSKDFTGENLEDDGNKYDTIIKGDDRVVWYKVVKIDDDQKENEVCALQNVLGKVALTLDKTADATDTLPSLYEGDQNIHYTLTPGVTNSYYPLDSYVLEDIGLTAVGLDESGKEKDVTDSLKEKYSITKVVLGKVSHECQHYATSQPAINATVTFCDFDGYEYKYGPINVSESEQTVNIDSVEGIAGKRIKSFSISYTSEGLENNYKLGENFKPGTVELDVHLERQDGDETKPQIRKIVNTAEATVTYRKWNASGVQATEATTLNATADTEYSFEEMDAPKIKIEKAVEGNSTVALKGNVVYNITVTNTSEEGGKSLKNPVIIDLLPQGVTLENTNGHQNVELTGENADNWKIENSQVPFEENNTAAILKLTGELDPEDSVTVKVTAKVNESVPNYYGNSDNSMINYAFVTTETKGIENAENPDGSAFKADTGEWTNTDLGKVAQNTGLDEERAKALAEEVEEVLTGYGFISASAKSNWVSNSGIALLKENQGALDEDGYRSDRLARTSRYPEDDESNNGNWVDYRLTVTNTSSSEKRSHLAIIDVLPAEGDTTGDTGTDRFSEWKLEFDSIRTVSVDGTPTSDYRVYYTTLPVNQVDRSVVNTAEYNGSAPTGWQLLNGETVKSGITAIMIVLEEDISLGNNEKLVVEYRTTVPEEYRTDETKFAEDSYENAVNDFQAHFWSYPASKDASTAVSANNFISSDVVSATMMPDHVKVGGHIWIDANDNGIQDKDEYDKDGAGLGSYWNYKIVKNMLKNIRITLNTYHGTDDSSSPKKYGEDLNTSAAEYTFEGLDAASPKTENENELYETDASGKKILKPRQLRGSAPATYTLSANMANVKGNFEIIDMSGLGMSRDPLTLAQYYPGETTDNNYSTSGVSERFFLYPSTSETYDDTKDLGLVLYRDLTLTKVAADDPDTKVEGATFAVYGPFDSDDKAKATDLSAMSPKFTGTTDENGEVTFKNLLWFKSYVIVETSTGQGYELDGATATEADAASTEIRETANYTVKITGEDGSVRSVTRPGWVLGIPGTDSMVTTEKVTVNNVRKTTAEFSVTKELTGRDVTGSDSFTFELWDKWNEWTEENAKAIDTVTISGSEMDGNAGTAKFDSVTLKGVGNYVFYIREKPESISGVTYDQKIYQVKVTTTWEQVEGHWQMTVTDPVYKLCDGNGNPTGTASESITFTNEYKATGIWQLTGTKNLTGRYQKAEEFTFNLVETDADGNPLKTDESGSETYVYSDTAQNTVDSTDKTKGTFTFDKISYTKNETVDQAVDHYYLITEATLDTGKGLAANSQQFLVKVTVTDNGDGTLTATTAEVKENTGKNGAWEVVTDKAVEFENIYTSSGSDTLNGRKTVTGGPMRNFTFGIYIDESCENEAAEGTNGRVTNNKVSNSDDGNFTFTVHFTQDDITDKEKGTGTVTLYVKEEGAAKDDATTNDTTLYRVTYSLKDTGMGNIDATNCTIEKKAEGGSDWSAVEGSVNGVTFNNEYEATGSVKLTAKKVLTGRNFAADEFTFQLLDAEENKLQTKKVPAGTATAESNTYSAGVAFEQITYDMDDLAKATGGYEDEKTFTYYIVEEAGNAEGVTYSHAKYKVEVTVKDAGDGTLTVSKPVITQVLNDLGQKPENESVEEATFTNDFKASGSVTLKAAKNLKGQTLSDGQFTFTLTDVTEGLADENKVQAQPVTNTGTAVSFVLANVYDQDDAGKTFTYEIREQNDGKDGYTYSEAVYQAEVTVSLKKDETGLETSVQYTKYNTETNKWDSVEPGTVVFNNSYKASGSATINGTKTVTYRDMEVKADEFTFLLKEGDTKIAEIKTEAGGDFSYEFKYEIMENTTDEELAALLGEHTYTLEEIPGADQNMTYSGQKYTIKITVDDNDKDGELNVSTPVVTDENGDTVENITFTNTYKATGEATLNITKNLTGNRAEGIGENEFSFTVTPVHENGEAAGEAQTVQIPAAAENTPYTSMASVTFSYDQDDLNTDGSANTYWYRISENDTAAASVTKDNAVYYAKVVISNSGQEMETLIPQ